MPGPSLLACPFCARSLESLRALPGAQVRCPSCRRPVLVVAPPTEPPPCPPPLPRADSFTQQLPLVVGLLLLVSLTLVVAACVSLRTRQEERLAAQANAQVTAHLSTAGAEMQRQRWDRAIQVLEVAESLVQAGNRASIGPVLREARRGQARALLEAAQRAADNQDADQALTLLRAYRAHAFATEPVRAERLHAAIQQALSEREALSRLERMSDNDLALLASGETVPDLAGPAGAQNLFVATLRRLVVVEQQKRTLKRLQEQAAVHRRQQEEARAEARLRSTPAFRELAQFVAETLSQVRQARAEQDVDLEPLFQNLGINDADERAEARQRLRPDDSDRTQIARLAAARRAAARLAFRRSAAFHAEDASRFDRLIDRELAKLTK